MRVCGGVAHALLTWVPGLLYLGLGSVVAHQLYQWVGCVWFTGARLMQLHMSMSSHAFMLVRRRPQCVDTQAGNCHADDLVTQSCV